MQCRQAGDQSSSVVKREVPNPGARLMRFDVACTKLGGAYVLDRAFCERVTTSGIAPIRAHRQLTLPGDPSAITH